MLIQISNTGASQRYVSLLADINIYIADVKLDNKKK